ncbi:hypothetical protein [Natronosalvus rutilus]|uniref:Uncharacterized protein n=1 Tax=Natronosalvus rutilus TaxID=2953753 RepID=A0A9E7NFJ8_9EURY|nr:hypothetical protein [Natronosalvus rutilus]UTF55908.1 hypothetical protein NGM29_20105 [Natronosalvus rutilus]
MTVVGPGIPTPNGGTVTLDENGDLETMTGNDKTGVSGPSIDSDGDRIPDDAENEKVFDGAILSNADPTQKDLYVVFFYSNDSERLTDTEKRQLRSIWGSMNVSNPNGESGINLHIVEERRAQHEFSRQYPENVSHSSELADTYDEYIDNGCSVYHLVILGEIENRESVNVGGWGDGPGLATYVDHENTRYSSTEYGSRVRTITHELLHNVVGPINGSHAPNDPKHSKQGWLGIVEHERDLPKNEALHPAVASQLSDDFAESPYYRQIC